MKVRHLLCVALALLPCRALALDIAAVGVTRTSGCVEFTLCNAEDDATGACDTVSAAGAGNIVADLSGRDSHIACLGGSTATTIACNLYNSNAGYHATQKSTAVLASALTEVNYCAPVSGMLSKTWAECTTVTGGTVTLKVLSCPSAR